MTPPCVEKPLGIERYENALHDEWQRALQERWAAKESRMRASGVMPPSASFIDKSRSRRRHGTHVSATSKGAKSQRRRSRRYTRTVQKIRQPIGSAESGDVNRQASAAAAAAEACAAAQLVAEDVAAYDLESPGCGESQPSYSPLYSQDPYDQIFEVVTTATTYPPSLATSRVESTAGSRKASRDHVEGGEDIAAEAAEKEGQEKRTKLLKTPLNGLGAFTVFCGCRVPDKEWPAEVEEEVTKYIHDLTTDDEKRDELLAHGGPLNRSGGNRADRPLALPYPPRESLGQMLSRLKRECSELRVGIENFRLSSGTNVGDGSDTTSSETILELLHSQLDPAMAQLNALHTQRDCARLMNPCSTSQLPICPISCSHQAVSSAPDLKRLHNLSRAESIHQRLTRLIAIVDAPSFSNDASLSFAQCSEQEAGDGEGSGERKHARPHVFSQIAALRDRIDLLTISAREVTAAHCGNSPTSDNLGSSGLSPCSSLKANSMGEARLEMMARRLRLLRGFLDPPQKKIRQEHASDEEEEDSESSCDDEEMYTRLPQQKRKSIHHNAVFADLQRERIDRLFAAVAPQHKLADAITIAMGTPSASPAEFPPVYCPPMLPGAIAAMQIIQNLECAREELEECLRDITLTAKRLEESCLNNAPILEENIARLRI